MDSIQVRVRGKNNNLETRTGSVTKTLNEIDASKKQRREISQATQRLKVLEQLEQYREEKVAQEMMVLEMQRQMEDEKMQKALAAERKKQAYLEKQKAKVQEYQAKKAQEEQEKRAKAEKEKNMAAS